jgi:peptidyl-prolyl cis-trans isomerase SurA
MLTRVALMLLCMAFISSSLAQSKKSAKKEKNRLLFSVSESPVFVDEFIYLYTKNHQNQQEDFTEEKISEYLNLYINFKLKVLEAKRRGMDTTTAFIKEYNSYKEELRKPYLPETNLTDSLVKLTYERMRLEIKASHILFKVEPDAPPADTLKVFSRAMDIRKRILAGEDFATLAMTYSEDPSAKSNQGSLGYFSALQMVYPFETAAYTTSPGQVSMPVRTRFGYHLIKVYDKRAAQGEVEVSHIMIRTGEDKDDKKARDVIFSIHEKLQAGVAWDELCREYSEDPATKENGGRLRPITTGAMASVPEFEEMAFHLKNPGDISDPLQTQFGWHVLRLEKKIPLASYAAMESTLRGRVLRDERTTLTKKALLEKLRSEYGLIEYHEVRKSLLALADSLILQRGLKKLPSALDNQILMELNDRDYRLGEFLNYARENQVPNSEPPAKYMEQLYNKFIDASILEVMEQKIVAENPTFRFLLNEYYEGILLFEIMEKEVWNKASNDSTGQRTYYVRHQSNYMAGERAKAVIYSSKTADFREIIQKWAEAGHEDSVHVFVRENKIKVESGYYQRDEKPVLKDIPWASGVYSAENNGIYYLAWLKDILPQGPMSFEESRAAIISDYQTYLEGIWLEDLKKKYTVKVNEKGKKYILQQLRAN